MDLFRAGHKDRELGLRDVPKTQPLCYLLIDVGTSGDFGFSGRDSLYTCFSFIVNLGTAQSVCVAATECVKLHPNGH